MTAELRLEPATADHIRALIAGDDSFREQFGVQVIEGYLEFDGVLEAFLRQLEEGGADPEWSTHLVVHTGDAALIGLVGYKGPPADGTVEIGYGIAPAYRRQGYATEAARLLIERAQARGVTTVIAHTLAEANPSTRLLTGHGFVRTATVEDPEDGTLWRWEKPLTATG